MKITKLNNKGIVVETVLIYIVAGLVLFFVPNPISSATGIGVRPNKSVQSTITKEEILPVLDADGNQIAFKKKTTTQTADMSEQQKVSIWEQLRHLPFLFIALIILGGGAPLALSIFWAVFNRLKNKWLDITDQHEELNAEVKTIIGGVDEAFATIPMTLAGENLPGEIDRAALAKKIQDKMLAVLSSKYDKSTKELVRAIRT